MTKYERAGLARRLNHHRRQRRKVSMQAGHLRGDAMKATDIKERPILFSAPMIRAILRDENPKTQTRRVAMDLPSHPAIARWVCDSNGWWEPVPHSEQVREQYITTWPAGFYRCKYGKPGDRLWVKEKHVLLDRDGWSDPARPRDAMISGRRNGVGYADFEHDPDSERCRKELGYKWRPSIHMPRWASRVTLEITDVRVQRLQDISDADILAEGFDGAHLNCENNADTVDAVARMAMRVWYSKLWDSINGKRSPWSANPFVWALTFKRMEQP